MVITEKELNRYVSKYNELLRLSIPRLNVEYSGCQVSVMGFDIYDTDTRKAIIYKFDSLMEWCIDFSHTKKVLDIPEIKIYSKEDLIGTNLDKVRLIFHVLVSIASEC